MKHTNNASEAKPTDRPHSNGTPLARDIPNETLILPAGNLSEFDLGKFRVTQEHFGTASAEKIITTVPVDKPPKSSFFRTHPDPDYSVEVGVVELPVTKETYLVTGDLVPALDSESTFRFRHLVTTVTRSGAIYLWPIGEPTNNYARSAHEIAALAKSTWLRLRSNQETSSYEAQPAADQSAEPVWPKKSLAELIKLAFKGRIIDSIDHPVLRELRGEI